MTWRSAVLITGLDLAFGPFFRVIPKMEDETEELVGIAADPNECEGWDDDFDFGDTGAIAPPEPVSKENEESPSKKHSDGGNRQFPI